MDSAYLKATKWIFPKELADFLEFMIRPTQHGQMDVHIKFWDNSVVKVVTWYLRSQFLGHSAAKDLLEVSRKLNLWEMIQVSMAGSSVSWSFLDMLKEKHERELDNPNVLNFESCRLHRVHLLTGARVSEFEINSLLSSLY